MGGGAWKEGGSCVPIHPLRNTTSARGRLKGGLGCDLGSADFPLLDFGSDGL